MAETLRSSNGQIIFRNSSYGIIPDRRCEVFVGRVPRDINLKDDIVPLFRSRGRLVEFRLLVSFSGHCRGFGFAIYATKEEAREAIIAFNNYEIRSGWYLGVCWSKNKCKISLINLPKSMAPDKVAKFIYDVSDSCVPGDDPLYIVFHKSGSSVVWEHKTHRAAALNRKNITGPAASTFGPQTQVIWVDFSMQIDSEEYPIMATREGSVVKLSHTDVNLIKTYDGILTIPKDRFARLRRKTKILCTNGAT